MDDDIVFGIVIGLIFISLIVIFCIILLKLYVRKIRNYTSLLYQKELDFQITLTSTVIETQEQLLHDISQDLHDDAGQQLTYINFQIENLMLDSPELKAALEPVSASVGMLSKSVRALSHSLNNQMVTQQDLVRAIASEIKRLKKNGRIMFQFQAEDTAQRTFDTNQKIVIYRIFQEVLNNAIKHAKARNISTTITTSPVFQLTVKDDGIGFLPGEIKGKPGMGLQNLRHRAQLINCKIDIQSVINEGTTITLTEISQ